MDHISHLYSVTPPTSFYTLSLTLKNNQDDVGTVALRHPHGCDDFLYCLHINYQYLQSVVHHETKFQNTNKSWAVICKSTLDCDD